MRVKVSKDGDARSTYVGDFCDARARSTYAGDACYSSADGGNFLTGCDDTESPQRGDENLTFCKSF